MTGSRNVILPLAIAFLIYWLGTLKSIPAAAGRFQPVKPVQPQPKVIQ